MTRIRVKINRAAKSKILNYSIHLEMHDSPEQKVFTPLTISNTAKELKLKSSVKAVNSRFRQLPGPARSSSVACGPPLTQELP